MAYTTASTLVKKFGADHCAELADPTPDLVTGELLQLTLDAGDRSQYETEERDAADEAVDVIDQAIGHATSVIDSYLGRRYDLPLTSDVVEASVVPLHCLHIAHYELADSEDKLTDNISKRYENCIAWLKDVANGKAGLGAGASEGEATAADTAVNMRSQVRRAAASRFSQFSASGA